MITQKLLLRLLFLAVMLPVALAVVLATGHLLRSMDDRVWGDLLVRLGLVGGMLWVTTLVMLLLALAVRAAAPPRDQRIEKDSPAADPIERKEE